jgi:hypothetical protein
VVSKQRKKSSGLEKKLLGSLSGSLKTSAWGALGATAPASPALPSIPLIPSL